MAKYIDETGLAYLWTKLKAYFAKADHAHDAMTGATSAAAGAAGMVPAPAAGTQTKFLRGDGTWQTPTNTTYSAATTSAAGLMSAADKTKLDGVAANATANEASSTTPKVAGTATVGVETAYARGDHVHPAQTSVTGNAGTATKLATARTIALSGAVTGTATSFNGTANITIPVTSVDGAKITGTIPLSSIPKGAQERLYPVADDTARLALTAEDVQNGDVVKVESTGIMYYVADETKLGGTTPEAAFAAFTAGTASSVDWSGVTNKPSIPAASATLPLVAGTAAVGTGTTWARADHVHPAQTSVTGNAGTATKLATARTIQTNLSSTSSASFNGSANITPGVTGTLPIANGGTGATTTGAATNNLMAQSLAPGIAIASGDDLDEYTTIGTYYSGSSTISAAIVNTPHTTSGYMLTVYNPYGATNTSYRVQRVETYNGSVYRRYYSSSTWSNWVTLKFTDTNTTYSAGTGLSLSGTTFALGTSGATAGSYGPSANASPAHSGTFSVPYITVDAYGRITSASTKTITLPADANTDTKVQTVTTNPTTATTYYPTFATGATTGTLPINNGVQYITLEGTTTANGYGILKLGNSTASGTAANKYGAVRLYGTGAYYSQISPGAPTANVTHTLPTTGGTLLNSGTTSFTQSLTSGTAIGTLKLNGTSYTLYAPTNTDTTYAAMTGATSSAAGTSGLVPAPAAGKQTSFLRGDGTWVVPTNTTYSAATTSTAGLMSAADKTKLDGIVSITNAEIDAIMV